MRLLLIIALATAAMAQQRGNIDYDQVRSSARKGTGQQFQMFCSGTATSSGQAAVYDVNGNVCPGTGTGGGSAVTQSPLRFPRYQAPLMPLGLSVTSPITIANTTTSTSIIGQSYFGSASFPASFAIGHTVRIRASGLYGSTASPTLTIIVVLGGVTIATLTPTILSAASGDGWTLDYAFTPVSMVAVNGAGCFVDVGTAGAIIGGCASGQTAGLDFAAAQTLDIQFAWSAASASNTITAEVVQVS